MPEVSLAVEHYNRMIRVLDKGLPVKVELNVDATFYDERRSSGFNTIAELPGTDLASGDRPASARTSTRTRRDRRDRQRRPAARR